MLPSRRQFLWMEHQVTTKPKAVSRKFSSPKQILNGKSGNSDIERNIFKETNCIRGVHVSEEITLASSLNRFPEDDASVARAVPLDGTSPYGEAEGCI